MKKTFTFFKAGISSVLLLLALSGISIQSSAQTCTTGSSTGCNLGSEGAAVTLTPGCNTYSTTNIGPGATRTYNGFTAGVKYDFYISVAGTNGSTTQMSDNGTCVSASSGSPLQKSGATSYVLGASRAAAIACGTAWPVTSATLSYRITPPTTAAAGADQNNCNNSSFTVTGNSPTTGTGTWSKVSGTGSVTSGGAVTGVTAGASITCRYTIDNGGCTSTDDVICTNYINPGTASVGATQDRCNTLTSAALGGNAIAVGTATWSKVSGPGTVTFSAVNSGSSTASVSAYGTYVLQWTFPANGPCGGSSANITVNFTEGATVGATQYRCGTLTSAALGGNNPTVGSGAWTQVSGPGTSSFSASTSGSSTATATAYGTYVYRWTVTGPNSGCSTTADITVNYTEAASVGATQYRCGTLTSAALGGNTPTVGSGAWTQVSGPGTSTFSASTSGSSTATATAYGTYAYRWTVSGPTGGCNTTADITVNYTEAATVGVTQYRCGTLTSAALGGNTPTVGSGAWTQVSGPGSSTFSASTSGSSTATATAYGTYVYRWTVSGPTGGCNTTADITVNYTEAASVGTSPQAAPCNTLTSSGLGGNTPTLGSGAWSVVIGPGSVVSWNPNNSTPGATATGSTYGAYTFRWTVTNIASGCNTSADIVVNYNQSPVISGPTSVCDIETNVQYNSSVPGVAWTVNSGIGSIGGVNGQYTSGDIATPTQTSAVVIRATNITCSTDYNVTVYNKATINPIANQCEGAVVTLGSDVNGVSFSGTGVSGGPYPTAYTFTAPTPGGASQNYTITLSNGLFGCGDAATVTVYKTMTITPANPISVCDVSSVSFTSSLSVTQWNISSGTGSFSSPIGTNTTYTPANIAAPTGNTATTITAVNGECTVVRNITNYNDNSIITANNTPVCDASTLTIDGDVNGVAWSSAAGGSVTTGVQDPTFTPSNIATPTQNTTVVVTATNGTCTPKTVTIRVDNDNSIITSSPAPVCDNTTQLIDGDVSGVVWSSASGGSVTTPGEDATFTPTALGVPLSANVVVTATNGACTPKTITMEVRKASTAPTALTPSTGFVECVGDAFTLTASGATLGYGASYKLYSGSCGGTLVASNGTGIFAPTPGATTTYYARVEGCNTTTCQSATVTANSPLDIIPASGVKTCVYNGTISGEKYLVNSSNEALLSIDEGSYNLGNVTATVTTYGSVPAQAGSIQCDAPLPSVGPVGGDELYLPREFDVTTQNTPGGYVTVSLYFTQTELTALANATTAASAAYQSCWGTVASNGSNLMLTIEHSPSSYETRLQGSGLSISAGPWAGTYKATFQVNQFSGFKLHGNGGVNGANGLPVEMIYFEANAINNAFIQLTWATALEVNNDGFYVERSVDGQNWTQLDFVNGHDNTTVQQDYSYNDMDVVPGVRYYYRLLQVDNDGQSEHTGVRTAMINGEVTFNVMDFVPNPTMNQTTLIVTATKEQSITIDIYDVIGQKVMSTVNQLNKGANSIKFDLSKLAAGTYTAGVSAGNETYSKKLIITR